MSAFRTLAVTAAAVALLAHTAHAQSFGDPEDAPVQAGPLALSPTIRITNFGFDSNVFSQSEAQDPKSDVTATLSPVLDAWLRLPNARVACRSEFNAIYFKELRNLRSLDTANAVNAELSLNRFRPYFTALLSNTRHRLNVEIDAPVRLREDAVTAGVDMRVGGKSTLGIRGFRSVVDYAGDAVYLESNLSRLLNRRTMGQGATYRYAVTPLTTVGMDVTQQQDRFEFSPDRDSNRTRVAGLVELHPHALISGRFRLGVDRRVFVTRDQPDAKGSFMLLDLYYTLLGRTRIGVQAQRDYAYSFRIREEEYQLAGITVSVTQRLSDLWDIRARVGRQHLTYRETAEAAGAGETPADTPGDTPTPPEILFTYGVDLGYRLQRTRLGIEVNYGGRDATDIREYKRLRVASSITYAF